MRKVFVILLVMLAVAAAAVSTYFVFSKEEEHVADTLYDAIPLDAGLIVDVRNYGDLCRQMRESSLWGQLREIPSIGTFTDEVMFLDSLSQKNEYGKLFRGHLILSVHPVGKDGMASVGYVSAAGEKEARNMVDLLKRQLTGKAVFSERSYDQVTVTDVAFNEKDRQTNNFSCAYRSGIFVFSRSSILLENALRQIIADDNITRQEKLAELMRTAGKSAPANVYVNYTRLPYTALTVLHAKHRRLVEPLARFAEWTELDLNLRSDLLVFNGFTACNPSSEQWLSAFQNQQAGPVTLVDAMPSTTHAFLWMGIHELQRYFADYGRYLEQYKETAYKKELARIKNTYQIDLQKDFAEQFENEVALVYARVGQSASKEDAFVLFRIKSASSTADLLKEWQTAVAKYHHTSVDQAREILQFDYQMSFTAYKLPFDLPASLFGDIFSGDNGWCVPVDNYLVFASSPANLKKYLHYTALHASLQADLTYGKLVNHFSTRCNVMFYCSPSSSKGLLETALKYDKYKETEKAAEALSSMQAVVYQLNNTNGMLYNNLFLKYSSVDEPGLPGTQTSWESLLDTAISLKPELVKNHTTGETEVFVQDMAGNIYLLNNVGRILWKVKLPEQIIGRVYQVDLYRNGKLQMFFSTRNYLYVVDRLGSFVEKFPVKLNSPAVGGMALFDYDNDKKYRIMIACEDRKVYAYEKTGKLLDGWSFRQSEYPVQTDICHYRAGNKDYIVFADKYSVYILDRQGRTRVSPERNLPVGINTVIALDEPRSPEKAALVLADTAGTVHYISLSDGKMTSREVKAFPSSHFFVFQDITGDGHGDFIYACGNKLEAFRHDAVRVMDIDTEEPVTERPYVYEFGANDLRIGIVQPQNNHIRLYGADGKLCKGFPMKGSTLFSIGRLDKTSAGYNLFVGSKNNFLYNYSVR